MSPTAMSNASKIGRTAPITTFKSPHKKHFTSQSRTVRRSARRAASFHPMATALLSFRGSRAKSTRSAKSPAFPSSTATVSRRRYSHPKVKRPSQHRLSRQRTPPSSSTPLESTPGYWCIVLNFQRCLLTDLVLMPRRFGHVDLSKKKGEGDVPVVEVKDAMRVRSTGFQSKASRHQTPLAKVHGRPNTQSDSQWCSLSSHLFQCCNDTRQGVLSKEQE